MRIRIQYSRSMMIRIRIQGSGDQKLKSLQPLKENIQHFNIKFLYFLVFSTVLLWVIFALLDPDPADQNQCGSMLIRLHNTLKSNTKE